MNIQELGGEFALIDRIDKKITHYYNQQDFSVKRSIEQLLLKGIGDDAAACRIKIGFALRGGVLVFTTDSLMEDVHFSRRYFSGFEVGIKAMEVNLSDIAAMGAKPLYALISLALPKNTSVAWVDELYDGLLNSCFFHKNACFAIMGGNISLASKIGITIFLVGKTDRRNLKFRNAAEVGDKIKVTGSLGNSYAGFQLLARNIAGCDALKSKHKMPRARLDLINPTFMRYVHALQDISDGLVGDVQHMCRASNRGAMIDVDNLPIDVAMTEAAKKLQKSVIDMALYGGEDYELLYTVSSEHAEKTPGYVIGEIISKNEIILIGEQHQRVWQLDEVTNSFDHFT